MPRLLTTKEVDRRLLDLEGWRHEGEFIARQYRFEDFREAMSFLNKVARIAEKQDHHPDIHVRYNEVLLMIQTHSEGGVTVWDFELAEEINRVKR